MQDQIASARPALCSWHCIGPFEIRNTSLHAAGSAGRKPHRGRRRQVTVLPRNRRRAGMPTSNQRRSLSNRG